jgi:hypothetical protein
MNLHKMLHELHEDKQRLEQVISLLEELRENPVEGQSSTGQNGQKRGRKSMAAEERNEVSARMKKYWATRRNQKTKVASA